jgi:hypothetical protein
MRHSRAVGFGVRRINYSVHGYWLAFVTACFASSLGNVRLSEIPGFRTVLCECEMRRGRLLSWSSVVNDDGNGWEVQMENDILTASYFEGI